MMNTFQKHRNVAKIRKIAIFYSRSIMTRHQAIAWLSCLIVLSLAHFGSNLFLLSVALGVAAFFITLKYIGKFVKSEEQELKELFDNYEPLDAVKYELMKNKMSARNGSWQIDELIEWADDEWRRRLAKNILAKDISF